MMQMICPFETRISRKVCCLEKNYSGAKSTMPRRSLEKLVRCQKHDAKAIFASSLQSWSEDLVFRCQRNGECNQPLIFFFELLLGFDAFCQFCNIRCELSNCLSQLAFPGAGTWGRRWRSRLLPLSTAFFRFRRWRILGAASFRGLLRTSSCRSVKQANGRAAEPLFCFASMSARRSSAFSLHPPLIPRGRFNWTWM